MTSPHEEIPGEPHRRSSSSWRDPRVVVGTITLIALVVGGLASWSVTSSMRGTRSSVEYLIDQTELPKDQLLLAERSNERGQQALAGAVSATGDERTRLLSEAISASQDTTAAWETYRSSAIGFPGEDQLARQYEADQVAASETSSAALVPILNSTAPGTLPPAEIATHQAVTEDLQALHTMYREADREALTGFRDAAVAAERWAITVSVAVLLIILVSAAFGFRRANRVRAERRSRRAARRLAGFETRLRRALELIDDDYSAYKVAERGMQQMSPDGQVSLLVADSSRAALTPIAQSPVCAVSAPEDCPAMRSTTAVATNDSDSLDACPMLTAHTPTRCSATCIPITAAGRSSAVIQVVGEPGRSPDGEDAALLAARGVGDRVTLLQALATFQLQAARDPLTGLLNRRSLMLAVEPVVPSDLYSVGFCDLDHFKQLNDLHGHEAGDRALQAFAKVLIASLRPQDIICRWGGEEFVIVLPGCDAWAAVEAMDRVRANLAFGAVGSGAPMFTASFGVAESGGGAAFDDAVGCADAALRDAKEAGRDRVVRYDPAQRHVLAAADSSAERAADLISDR